jgi:hypothetical protein
MVIFVETKKYGINDIANLMKVDGLEKNRHYLISDLNINLKINRNWDNYLSDNFYTSEINKVIQKRGMTGVIELADRFPVININAKNVITEQNWVYSYTLVDKLNQSVYKPIKVIKGLHDSYLLIDGNHTLLAQLMKNKKIIKAHVVTY